MRFLIKFMSIISIFTFLGCKEEPTGPGVSGGWEKTFGGSNSDHGYSVQQTTDGGYIFAGKTESFGAVNSDVYLVKTDKNGDKEWSRLFGGSGSEGGYCVKQTIDGGYIVVGYTSTFGVGGLDVYLLKTDGSGNEVWSNTFGGIHHDKGYSVQQTTDGGYVVTGVYKTYDEEDIYLIKIDALGNEQWSKTFGGGNHDLGYSVQQTTDGGYIIAGYTWSFGADGRDIYIVKTNEVGNEEWSRTFGGSGIDCGYSVQQTTDGGYIVVGAINGPSDDLYLVKTDTLGLEVWSMTFGGSDSDYGYSIQHTMDDGFIIVGGTESFGEGSYDVYLIKTDILGNEQWARRFGGSEYEGGHSIQQTTDGGYIIVGETESFGVGSYDVYLIKTDVNGDISTKLGVNNH